MDAFVKEDSIVRKIWGKSDTILFIFAAASAEFALNKAVDWLFYTGKLPSDPLGRLFSTVAYARQIVFSSSEKSNQVIDTMKDIHKQVEHKRGFEIPAWAYRDVLFMLIDYSVRSYELLYDKLNEDQKNEVYDVFNRVGTRMGLIDLPDNYPEFVRIRQSHMENDLTRSNYTIELYKQYHKHLGPIRYRILLLAQSLVVPDFVKTLLGLKRYWISTALVGAYKVSMRLKLDWQIMTIILPRKYISQVRELQKD